MGFAGLRPLKSCFAPLMCVLCVFWGLAVVSQIQIIILAGVLLAVIALVALVARLYYRTFGWLCLRCGRRLAFFDELPRRDQQDIRRSLERFSDGLESSDEPFACLHCNRVYDDYVSSRDGLMPSPSSSSYCPRRCKVCKDWLRHPAGLGIRIKPGYPMPKGNDIECVGCTRGPASEGACVDCDTPAKLYLCRQCLAPHIWQQPPGQRFQYLLPLAREENGSQDSLKEPLEPS